MDFVVFFILEECAREKNWITKSGVSGIIYKIDRNFQIFIIVFFIYIHIVNQYKKSVDLEIYEMDYKNKAAVEKLVKINKWFCQEIAYFANKLKNTPEPNADVSCISGAAAYLNSLTIL